VQRWAEAEKRRVEERISGKSKSQEKEDGDARKGKKVTKHCVFLMFCGSLKRRVRGHLSLIK
jgi:hypothetical protein